MWPESGGGPRGPMRWLPGVIAIAFKQRGTRLWPKRNREHPILAIRLYYIPAVGQAIFHLDSLSLFFLG